MSLEKVSIIIPCYNQAEFLGEACESILNQTYSNWECIIVNDGSPDNTESAALLWCERDTRFKYVYKENGGLSSARNFGFQKSIGAYILTLDADDKYAATFIEKGLKVFKINSEIGVVSSWISRFRGNNEICVIKPKGKVLKDFLYSNACNGTSLIRRKCWKEVRGYDESMKYGYEDWDFYIRVCSKNWKIHIIPEVLFLYRQHDFSMRLDAYQNHDVKIKKYMYMKHRDLYLENFEETMSYFLNTIDLEKRNNIKIRNKIDYRIGYLLLKPLRFLKSLFA